jgi:hypothetical protein
MSATGGQVTPRTRRAIEFRVYRVPLLWVGFVVASRLALGVLEQAIWSAVVPLTAAAL